MDLLPVKYLALEHYYSGAASEGDVVIAFAPQLGWCNVSNDQYLAPLRYLKAEGHHMFWLLYCALAEIVADSMKARQFFLLVQLSGAALCFRFAAKKINLSALVVAALILKIKIK
jgi:hypothetical protein